ncbi:hypothetical protein EDD11_000302 [Mortierella claussenii]|nr:hypothetical protein EDD11_000302 [Mortierella claussenii]
MKSSLIFATLAVASTASAYQCPAAAAINQSCHSTNVAPLICHNSNVNAEACNAKQCTQTYIDNYAACQCHHSTTDFSVSSVKVEGLLKRCGMAGLKNPYGDPNQYRSGKGTQKFAVIDDAPPVLAVPGTPTAAPIASPTETAAPVGPTHHISKGAIAGIVLGILAATALAFVLGFCWRRTRGDHTAAYHNTGYGAAGAHDGRGPSRTVVTEKIEPVVVKSVPGTGAAGSSSYNNAATGVGGTSSTHIPGTTSTNYNTSSVPASNLNQTSTTGIHPTGTSYNTTNTAGYNTQPRAGVVDRTENALHNAPHHGTGTNVHNSTH